jgi:branched-chain amino acid transport system ATP-binding protein
MATGKLADPPASLRVPTSTDILVVEGLRKSFGDFVAVNGIDLRIREGSIHALIGPNGAGKTTVFNLLTKFLMPTNGRIVFRSEDITRRSPAEIARMGIVRSFQISAIFPRLSVIDNLRVALQRKAGLSRQFWLSRRSLAPLDDRAMELLTAVGLDSYTHEFAGVLSYGRRRALEFATTLALEPDILLLDEPIAGLAHEDIPMITNLIGTISAGRTILMIEHNLSVVAKLCDRITVLQRGEVLADGAYGEVNQDPRVREAYLGSSHV